MKANVPEKIYLTTFGFPICEPIPQESSNPDTVWSKKPYTGADSIEYTRTDAFIEKAYNWLKNYAFVDDNKNVNLPTLLHDFLKDSRNF